MKEEFIRSDELAFCVMKILALDELIEYRNKLKVENQKRLEKLKLEN